MRGILLVFLSVSATVSAAKIDADTLAMVQAFLSAPVETLPPDSIDRFMVVDSASLPKKLRKPFEAKKLELYTLSHMAAGKKRGPFRSPETDCSKPKDAASNSAQILLLAGFSRISEQEERYLQQRTQCSEKDLMCEFSLQVVLEGKGKNQKRLYFLYGTDPLFAYVAEFRGGRKGSQTNFFGTLRPTCPAK